MDYDVMSDDELLEICKSYFEEDECALWQGKPSTELMGKDRITYPIAQFFMCFGCAWIAITCGNGSWSFLNGFFMMIAGFYISVKIKLKHRNIFYIITNKKLYRNSFGLVETIDFEDLPPMRVLMYKNGYGSILFSEKTSVLHEYNRYGVTFSLDNIPDVATVQRIISDML